MRRGSGCRIEPRLGQPHQSVVRRELDASVVLRFGEPSGVEFTAACRVRGEPLSSRPDG